MSSNFFSVNESLAQDSEKKMQEQIRKDIEGLGVTIKLYQRKKQYVESSLPSNTGDTKYWAPEQNEQAEASKVLQTAIDKQIERVETLKKIKNKETISMEELHNLLLMEELRPYSDYPNIRRPFIGQEC